MSLWPHGLEVMEGIQVPVGRSRPWWSSASSPCVSPPACAASTCSPASLWAAPSAQALWGTRCFFLVIFLDAKNSGNLWISYVIL